MLESRQTDQVEIRRVNNATVAYPHKENCPDRGKICHKCGKINHFAKFCRSAIARKQHKQWGEFKKNWGQAEMILVRQMDHTQSDVGEDNVPLVVNSVNKPLVTIIIDDSLVSVLVDTGSSINVLDEKTFQSLKQRPALTMEHNPVIRYAGNPMNIIGKFDSEIEGNQMVVRRTVYVTDEGKGNLLSYETAMQLGYIPKIGEINKPGETPPVKTTDRYSKLREEHNDIFEGIGKLRGVQVKLHIDETAQPVQNRHRRIPYHIREKVQEELEKLEQLDIIEEEVDAPTPWVSLIDAQPKPKKPSQLRICVDMRETNKAIRRERHVTPTIDDIIFELNGSSYFTKLDLNKGYHQEAPWST